MRAIQERVLAGIVAVLLPTDPPLDPQVRDAVAAEATRFVVLQVSNIPTFLRVPYRVAILGFHCLALFRHGRFFLSLPAERRRAYVTLWSDAPLGPMRDFVRLVRGCALLAYYDHAEVRRVLEEQRVTAVPDRRLVGSSD